MVDNMSEDGRRFVEWVWRQFRDTGEWPPRHLAMIHAEDLGLEYAATRSAALASEQRLSSSGPERVVLGLRSMVQIKEGRDLLRPLPRLLRRANAHFKTYPSFNDAHVEQTAIQYADVLPLWGNDPKRLALAAEILSRNDGVGGINLSGRFPTFTVYVDVEVLRYRGVRTLDDVLAVAQRRHRPKASEISQQHVDILRAVFAFVRDHLAWPNAALFAVRWRKGYAPDFVNDMVPHYVLREFSAFTTDAIQLRLWSLSVVDQDGSWRAKAARLAASTGELWRKHQDRQFALAELAAKASVPLHDAAVLCLMLQSEPWANGFRDDGKEPGQWLVGGDERARGLRLVETWDQYMEKRRGMPTGWSDGFGRTLAEGIGRNAMSDASLGEAEEDDGLDGTELPSAVEELAATQIGSAAISSSPVASLSVIIRAPQEVVFPIRPQQFATNLAAFLRNHHSQRVNLGLFKDWRSVEVEHLEQLGNGVQNWRLKIRIPLRDFASQPAHRKEEEETAILGASRQLLAEYPKHLVQIVSLFPELMAAETVAPPFLPDSGLNEAAARQRR